jgi:hypothetical protein
MESASGSQTRLGASPPETNRDDPTFIADEALRAEIAKTLSDTLDSACGITPDHVINRMGAMTCGGCHHFSNGKPIAPGVNWPRAGGFVHINEDGVLSELLLERFLPFRFAIIEKNAGGIAPLATSAAEVNALTATNPPNRAKLARLLDSVKKRGGYLSDKKTESGSSDIATIDQLSNELRRFDAAQPGAFVAHRKPD